MPFLNRYVSEWIAALAEFRRYRNTFLATLVVCLVTLINRHHTFASWLEGENLRKFGLPVYLLTYGLMLFFIPLLTSPLLTPSNRFGLRLGNVRTWFVDVLVAWGVLVVLILIFGRRDDFVRYYPMYKPPGGQWTWTIFLLYELCQFVYMFGWEFIFRGYLLFAARREVGLVPALILQMLPFAFLHIGKPELELYGSIAAGLFLGLIALRGNSFLPCAILHFLVAGTMDLFAALYKGALQIKF